MMAVVETSREDRLIALLWLAGGYRLLYPSKSEWEVIREIVVEGSRR